jgi:hypothetical protein
VRHIPEADPAKPEFFQVAPRAPAQIAAVVRPDLEFWLPLQSFPPRFFCHYYFSLNGTLNSFKSSSASSSVLAVVQIVMFMPRTLFTLS